MKKAIEIGIKKVPYKVTKDGNIEFVKSNLSRFVNTEMTIKEFVKLLKVDVQKSNYGYAFTLFPMKNGKRRAENALVKNGKCFIICIDFDGAFTTPEFEKFLKEKSIKYIKQISKSGKGLHIYIPVYVNTGITKTDVKYLLNLLRGFCKKFTNVDTKVFDFARFIYTSHYKPYESNTGKVVDVEKLIEILEVENKSNTPILAVKTDKKEPSKKGGRKKTSQKKVGQTPDLSNYTLIRKKFKEYEDARKTPLRASFTKLVKIMNNMSASEFRKHFGNGNILFGKMIEVIAYEAMKKGVIRNTEELIKYYDNFFVVSISPNEESKYDLFAYNNTDCVWLQSEKSIRHFDELRILVQVGKTSFGKEINRPMIAPGAWCYILEKIAKNWNVEVPVEFKKLFNDKIATFVGSAGNAIVITGFIFAITNAIRNGEEYLDLHIPKKFRNSRNPTFKYIKNWLLTEFNGKVIFQRDSKTKRWKIKVNNQIKNQIKFIKLFNMNYLYQTDSLLNDDIDILKIYHKLFGMLFVLGWKYAELEKMFREIVETLEEVKDCLIAAGYYRATSNTNIDNESEVEVDYYKLIQDLHIQYAYIAGNDEQGLQMLCLRYLNGKQVLRYYRVLVETITKEISNDAA